MVRIAWNLGRGGTKKSTRYQVPYPVEKPPKVNRTVPYHAVEKRHKKTICNTLCCEGLKSCSARKVPLLKKVHVQARLFTNDSEENWLKVLGSDETKIKLFGINRVWRRRNAAYDPKNTIPTVKHGGGNIMLWGPGHWKWVVDRYFNMTMTQNTWPR